MNKQTVTYDKLIDASGQPHFGRFGRPVGDVNHRDFLYRNEMDQIAGRLARHFHLKQFQFVGLVSERYTLGCAIVSVKYVSNAFVYLHDRHTGELRQKSLLQPLSLQCSMVSTPDHGMHRFRKGDTSFNFYAHNNPRSRNVEIFSGEDLRIDFKLSEPAGFQPIAVCTRTGFSGWTYTQKATTLSAEGAIHWGDLHIDLDGSFSGSYDWTCGYLRRHTAWNWASLSGRLADGTAVGANLANGVNETGFSENGIWIGNSLHPCGPVNLHFDRNDRRKPWRITSESGQLDLTFTPDGERREKLNLLLLASNFTQLTGFFDGSFTDAEGKRTELHRIPGFCEDHYAKW